MKHNVLSVKESSEIILNKIKSKEIFTYVRFGDGDFIMMYKDTIGNIVGHSNRFKVTEKLQGELVESYNTDDENYLIGSTINDFSEHSTHNNIKVDKLTHLKNKKEVLSYICLQETFLNDIGYFYDIVKEMKQTSTMFVSNYNHDVLNNFYGDIKYHVKVPKQNSYENIDSWYQEIIKNIDNVDKIILSSGQSSRVIAKRLYESGYKKTIIDVGALSDMLIIHTEIINNIPLRSHIKNNRELIKNNVDYLLKKIKE